MQVGELVKWERVLTDDMDRESVAYGIVVKLSRTSSYGLFQDSAQVKWTHGQIGWVVCETLVVINESR